MSSVSSTEVSTTIEIQTGTKKFVVDTMTLESQNSSAEFSSIEKVIGRKVTVTMAGHEFPSHDVSAVDCSQDSAIKKGGLLLSDLLAKELSDPAVADEVRIVRREIGRIKKDKGLSKLRFDAGLSQSDLATKLKTHQSAIARWESNPSTISFQNMCNLAIALQCSRNDVFKAIEEQVAAEENKHAIA